MLFQKLLGTQTASTGNLQFVGGRSASATSTQTPSYSLTGLTGGLASSPSIGDIVIVCIGMNNPTNRNIQCTTSGYTEVADLYNGTSFYGYCQVGVYYKVLTAADTSVAFNLGVVNVSLFVCQVWRGINSTPLDATTLTANMTTAPNPPAITTTTSNAVVIAIGGISDSNSGLGTPSGMQNEFFRWDGFGSYSIGIASVLVPSPSTYDPAAFTGGQSSRPCVAATMALRSL